MRILCYRNLSDYKPRDAKRGTSTDMARFYKAACYQRCNKLAYNALSLVYQEWHKNQANALLAADNEISSRPAGKSPADNSDKTSASLAGYGTDATDEITKEGGLNEGQCADSQTQSEEADTDIGSGMTTM